MTLPLYRPAGDDWIPRDLSDHNRRLDALEAGYDLDDATVGTGGLTVKGEGGVTVKGGGGVRVLSGGELSLAADTEGVSILRAGTADIPDGSGRTQQVVVVRRVDGTVALALADWGTLLNHPHAQALQWYDRAGRVVLADDTNSGNGLAAPHIESGGLHDTNVATWPATDAADWTTIANGYIERQNPRLTWQVQHYAATAGELRMTVDDAVIATATVDNAFGLWSTNAELPDSVAIGDVPLVQLQARVTGGSGTVHAQCLRLAGQQS